MYTKECTQCEDSQDLDNSKR